MCRYPQLFEKGTLVSFQLKQKTIKLFLNAPILIELTGNDMGRYLCANCYLILNYHFLVVGVSYPQLVLTRQKHLNRHLNIVF